MEQSKAISNSRSSKKFSRHTCKLCKNPRRFRTKAARAAHERVHHHHHSSYRHICKQCKNPRRFRTKAARAAHERVHHPHSRKGSMSSVEIGHDSAVRTGQEDEDNENDEDGKEIWYDSVGGTGQEDEDSENEEDGKEIWLTDGIAAIAFRLYAEAALEHYNNQNVGRRYALVENGPAIAFELMFHLNFKAKEEDCPSALVETFFAQFSTWPHIIVHCCISLGPSNMLPHWRKAQLGGCQFCHGLINHPTKTVPNLKLKLSEL